MPVDINKIREARWRGRTDLEWLSRNVLGYRDIEHEVHGPLFNVLQRFPVPALAHRGEYDKVTSGSYDYVKPYVPLLDLPGGRRRLILDPRGFFKCHRINSLQTLSNGTYKVSSSIKVGDRLRATVAEGSLRQGEVQVVAVEKQPPQPCCTVKLRSGRKLEVSQNHPVRLIDGWKDAGSLVPGDRPAVLGRTPEPKDARYEPSSEIVGWFLGDGSIRNQIVTNNDPKFREYICEAAERAGGSAIQRVQENGRAYYVRCRGLRPLFNWLGLKGKKSGDKFIPDLYFKADNQSLKELLFGLFMSDGCCTGNGLFLNTKSERMAHDIQRALLRFNIWSTVYPYKLTTGPYAGYQFFRVSVTSNKHVTRFIESIGWEKQCTFKFFDSKSNANTDTVPKGWRSRFGKYLFDRGKLPGSLKRKNGKGISTQRHDITKERLSLYAEALNDDELRLLASDEIFWDEVVEVIDDGLHETIAIQTSSGTICCDDVVTHNTTINVVSHTVQWILNYPDIAILIVHARQETAEDMLSEIKAHFVYNPVMRDLYPEYCFSEKDRGARSKFTVPNRRHRTRREATVAIASIESSIAGYHYDVIKCTDIVDPTNSATRDQCKKVIHGFGMLRNVLVSPSHWIDVEGTTYDFSDLYNTIIESEQTLKPEDRQWKIHVRGVYKKDTGGRPYTFLPQERELRDLLDEKGQKISWFPKKFPVHELELMRKDPSLGENLFQSQQLNNPMDPEGTKTFPLEQFRSKDHEVVRQIPMVYYTTTVDSAEVVSDESDYSVVLTCGWDSYGRCYVVDARHGKFKSDELIVQIFDVYRRWRPRSIKIEETGYVRGMSTSIGRMQDLSGIYLPLIFTPRDNQKAKEERIKTTLQPWYRRGDIQFDKDLGCLEHFKKELTSFPKGRTDDLIDALTDQFQDKVWSGRESDRATVTGEQFETSMKVDEATYRAKLKELMDKAMERKLSSTGEYSTTIVGLDPSHGYFDQTGGL